MSEIASKRDPTRALWLVDGYNVLRVSLSPRPAEEPGSETFPPQEEEADPGWWSSERRLALLGLASRLRAPAQEICLVFDARQLSEPREIAAGADWPAPEHIRSFFAPSADEWIVAAVRSRAPEFERRFVVTADRRLADRARSRGAEVVTTRRFVSLCASDDPVG